MSDVTCPFCNEPDFDMIGLKNHLQNDCNQFRETLTIAEERELRRVKSSAAALQEKP